MPIRYAIRKAEKFFVYRVMHVDDTPHRIALGVAIGIFVAWTPTIGLQMVLTLVLSVLLRANKLVGLPFVWLSNPLTVIPIYYPSYRLGRWMLGSHAAAPDFEKIFTVEGTWWGEIWLNRIHAWWTASWHAFWPLWLGSLVVATVLGVATYFILYRLIVLYRLRRLHRRERAEHPAECARGD